MILWQRQVEKLRISTCWPL